MSLIFTAKIGLVKKLDKNLQISFGYHDLDPDLNKTGALLYRTTKEDRAHIELKKITHPDSNKICMNNMNYTLCKGKLKAMWKWSEEDEITENDINIFKAYHENLTCSSMFNFNYDMAARTCHIDIEYAPTFTDWEEQPMIWDLDTTQGGLEWKSDDVEMLCMMRIADVTAWDIIQRDLLPGEETTVEKSGNECYVINTNYALVNNTKEVEKVDGLKLVSDSAVYKNISSEPQKILKYYK